MTHDELVEKVALAIAGIEKYQSAFGVVEKLDGAKGILCKKAARAAIACIYEAIREPTKEMAEKGVKGYWGTEMNTDAETIGQFQNAYRAMLDASVLKPGR